MNTTPTVTQVKRHSGVAGQYSMTAEVRYEGEPPQLVTFVGSTYGGPIVMVTPDGTQVFVHDRVLDRIGRTLDAGWVRAFFA